MRIRVKNLVGNILIWTAGTTAVIWLQRLDLPTWVFPTTVISFGLVGVFINWFFRTSHRRATLAVLAIAYVCVICLAWEFTPSGFRICYGNAPLNERPVPLARGVDPTRIQSQFYVWPNNPSIFTLVGITAKNVGNVVEEPEVVYLSFSTPVTPVPANDGWLPSSDYNLKGWTTYQLQFGLARISPGHSISIPWFSGTPVPHEPTRVKVTVLYGSKQARAEFTITP
jgi:hypothetical protein